MAREMKDSGNSLVGMIPRDWTIIPLKFTIRYNTSTLSDSTAPDYEFDYVDIGSVTYGKGIEQFQRMEFKDAPSRARRTVKQNDVILSTVRTYLKAVAAIPEHDCPIVVSTGFVTMTALDNIVPSFLKYAVQSDSFVCDIEAKSYGVSYPAINASEAVRTNIALPSLIEQKRIADFLDSKCAEIDALSADIQSEIETLEAYKRSVITEAVTKGLDKNVPLKDSGIEWAEKVPAHWEVMQNKYIMRKIKQICPVYNGEDILSLTMNGVIVRDLEAGGKMPSSFDGYQRVYPGNLLMCLFDYDVTPRCIGLAKNNGLTSPAYSQFVMKNDNRAEYYYYYYLMIDFTKELLHLAKNLRHSFTEDQLGMINAPVPPVDEQIAIAQFLDKTCTEIASIIAQKEEQLAVLADYKKSVIYEYVTGKKEVPA